MLLVVKIDFILKKQSYKKYLFIIFSNNYFKIIFILLIEIVMFYI